MRHYDWESEEFKQQTAVMDALPSAIHPIHDNWRDKADALIDGLRARGWDVTRVRAVCQNCGVLPPGEALYDIAGEQFHSVVVRPAEWGPNPTPEEAEPCGPVKP